MAIYNITTLPSFENNFIKSDVVDKVGCFSLFSGPGGLDLGFEAAGAEILFASDIDDVCVETYNYNRKNKITTKAINMDLSKASVDEIIGLSRSAKDYRFLGVVGGPPCQSFSVANVYSVESDCRHVLPEHYARILAGLRQKLNLDFFLFENVPGLTSKQHLEKFNHFKKMFKKAGFSLFQDSLNAIDFGVPQQRPRIFVVGFNSKKYPNIKFSFPKSEVDTYSTVKQFIEGLPEPVHNAKGLDPQTFPIHPNHWCLVPRSPKFRDGLKKRQGGKSFKVLDWDKPSFTVAYGNREVHVHPCGHRRLSIFEAMMLQGFPTNYVLTGNISDQVRLISEAVCPVVANRLAISIFKTLSEFRR